MRKLQFLISIYIGTVCFVFGDVVAAYLGVPIKDPYIYLRFFVMISSFIAGYLFITNNDICLFIIIINLIIGYFYGFLPLTFLIGYVCGLILKITTFYDKKR